MLDSDLQSHTTPARRPLPLGMLRRQEAAVWCGVNLRTWASWESAGLVPRPTAKILLYPLRTLRLCRDHGCLPRAEFEALIRAERHAGQPARDGASTNSHGRPGL
jgi:hypothetical protein